MAVGLAGAVCADGEDVAKCHGGADRVLLSPRVAAGYAVARHLRNTRSLDVRTCHVLQEFHLPEHGATLPLAPSLLDADKAGSPARLIEKRLSAKHLLSPRHERSLLPCPPPRPARQSQGDFPTRCEHLRIVGHVLTAARRSKDIALMLRSPLFIALVIVVEEPDLSPSIADLS